MAQIFDLFDSENFKAEKFLSPQNPMFAAMGRAHHGVFNAFDQATRANLSLAEDLLNLNRDRFDSLYDQPTFSEVLGAHKDIAMEAGKRVTEWGVNMREIATRYQSSLLDVTAASPTQAKAGKSPAGKKSKAA